MYKYVHVHGIQAVGCPYLDGMDSPVVSKVVFTPGEARIRVLTWLAAKLVNKHSYSIVLTCGMY